MAAPTPRQRVTMGARGTLILALLIVVVGAYLWIEEAPPEDGAAPATLLGEPRAGDPNQPVRHLLAFDPADIVAIHLERDGSTRDTKRSGDSWSDASPPAAIDDFLKNLAELPVLADIPAGVADLKDYGLEPPRGTVQLQRRGTAAVLVLLLGDRNPSVTGVYARLGEDGPVVLAGALVAWEFDKAYRSLGAADDR